MYMWFPVAFQGHLQFPQLNPPNPNMHLKSRDRICNEKVVLKLSEQLDRHTHKKEIKLHLRDTGAIFKL